MRYTPFALYKIHHRDTNICSHHSQSPQQAKDTFEVLNFDPGSRSSHQDSDLLLHDDWGKELGGLWEENAKANGYEVVLRARNPVGPNNDWSDGTGCLKAKAAGAEVLLTMPLPGWKRHVQDHGRAWLGAEKVALVIRAREGLNWGKSMYWARW